MTGLHLFTCMSYRSSTAPTLIDRRGIYLAFSILILLLNFSSAGRSKAPFARPVVDRPLSVKLALTSLDFGLPNVTLFQGLERGLRRSSLRFKHFQQRTASAATAHIMHAKPVSFITNVSAVPGGFATIASLGTPPVNFTAIVDTGSDLVWRQCLPCEHCYEQNVTAAGPIFNPSAHSSTYKQAPCNDTLCSALFALTYCSPTNNGSKNLSSPSSTCSYLVAYGNGSTFTMGDFSYDTLTLSDLMGRPYPVHHFAFGCGHNNMGPDFDDVNVAGIIGFGRGPVSLPSQLHTPMFSYCLQSNEGAASGRTSPLFIGSAAADNFIIPNTSSSDSFHVLSTPLIRNPEQTTFYYVSLEGISVGSKALDNIPPGTFDIQEDGSGGVIIDSGTTVTMLAAEAYDALVGALKANISLPTISESNMGYDLCYSAMSRSQLEEQAPSLTFHFKGANIQLPFANSFMDLSEKLVCLALGRSDDPNNLSIYGNIQQQNFHILYNLEAQSLSFAPTTCDTLS